QRGRYRDWLLSRRRTAAGRRVEGADPAGFAGKAAMPRQLQRALPAVRQEPERGKLQLRDGDARSAMASTGRYSQETGTIKKNYRVEACARRRRKGTNAKSKTAALKSTHLESPRT